MLFCFSNFSTSRRNVFGILNGDYFVCRQLLCDFPGEAWSNSVHPQQDTNDRPKKFIPPKPSLMNQ